MKRIVQERTQNKMKKIIISLFTLLVTATIILVVFAFTFFTASGINLILMLLNVCAYSKFICAVIGAIASVITFIYLASSEFAALCEEAYKK